MSLELTLSTIGLILGTVGSAVGTLGAIRAFLTSLRLKQMEQEKAQPNIDIDFKYEVMDISGKKFVKGSVILANIGEVNALINRCAIRFQSIEKLAYEEEASQGEPEMDRDNKLKKLKYIQGCTPIKADYDPNHNSIYYVYISKLNSLMKDLNLLNGKSIKELFYLDKKSIQELLANDKPLKNFIEAYKEEFLGWTQEFDIASFTEKIFIWNERIPHAISHAPSPTPSLLTISPIDDIIRGFQLSKQEKKRVEFCLECEGEGPILISVRIQSSPMLRKDASEEVQLLDAINQCFKLESLGSPNVEDWVVRLDSVKSEKLIQDFEKKRTPFVLKNNFRNKERFLIYI